MQVLTVGAPVRQVRFLPDGRRLLVSRSPEPASGRSALDLISLADGARQTLTMPATEGRDRIDAVALSPDGQICYVARDGRMHAFRTSDASRLPGFDQVQGQQVIVSRDGSRLLIGHFVYPSRQVHLQVTALTVQGGAYRVLWQRELEAPAHLAGFLPDGERFVSIDDKAVHVRAFTDGEALAKARYPSHNIYHPQISPDGKHLGVIGYGSMYFYDTAAPGKPRKISSGRTFGDFRSFAFHPGGRQLAVIHGGPTLVKLYDLATLRLTAKFNWKVGALMCLAFSPDGMLGAAGSHDGRIVLWDVDE